MRIGLTAMFATVDPRSGWTRNARHTSVELLRKLAGA
jgi:hypothetical protein